MNYRRLFTAPATTEPPILARRADLRDGSVYVWDEEIELAINVALATHRPLLVRGPSGSGKSSLAPAIARAAGWRYYEIVVSSRTSARDFLWQFDALRRLADAQVGRKVDQTADYVEPGVLWWAFDANSARRRGIPEGPVEAAHDPNGIPSESAHAVVLVDEIDKADPDVPNDLLVPLGSLEFTVSDSSNAIVRANAAPLIVITTNDERALPTPFLRRCVILTLHTPSEDQLVGIAVAHFGASDLLLFRAVAQALTRPGALREGGTAASTAGYLDTVAACLELGITPAGPEWLQVVRAVLTKPERYEEGRV